MGKTKNAYTNLAQKSVVKWPLGYLWKSEEDIIKMDIRMELVQNHTMWQSKPTCSTKQKDKENTQYTEFLHIFLVVFS
jgi:hypothetical protein